MRCKKLAVARCFDFLRNSPHSSIHIHFGVELLVFGAPLTSASLSKKYFFDRLKNQVSSGHLIFHIQGSFNSIGILP